jgi:hypothetical protein
MEGHDGQQREEKNDQVDCCCWLCFSRRNIGASNDASSACSAGPHDNASPYGLWHGQSNGQRRLPVQSRHAPGAPGHPQVCTISRRRLRSVALTCGSLEADCVAANSGAILNTAKKITAPRPVTRPGLLSLLAADDTGDRLMAHAGRVHWPCRVAARKRAAQQQSRLLGNSDQWSGELLNWLHRYNSHRPHGRANTPLCQNIVLGVSLK